MLTLNGRLISKSLIKEGVGQHGAWKIMEFVIERTYNKKKIKVAFTVGGKNADLVNTISFKERITVDFIPACHYSDKYKKYFTELKAISIQKYVKKNIVNTYLSGEQLNESDYQLKQDIQIPFTEGTK